MSVNGLYLDINKGKIYMPLEIYFYFLCLIKLSPGIIYLLHIKMLYFAFGEFLSLHEGVEGSYYKCLKAAMWYYDLYTTSRNSQFQKYGFA